MPSLVTVRVPEHVFRDHPLPPTSSTGMPLEVLLPVPLFLVYVALYQRVATRFQTEKQRAYVLSAFTSGMMTLLSLPFVASYIAHGLEATYRNAQGGWRADLARVGTIVFGVYLVADLAIGYIKYRQQIGFLTGWIHHIVYVFLMVYLLATGLSPVFMIGAIMELPTFDLGISTLFPRLRSDRRFLSSFLLIRIIFHAKLLVDAAKPSVRRAMGGAWVPIIALSLALVLHISWFQAGIVGYLKRRAKSRKTSTSTSQGESSANGAASEYESDDALRTPDDSPLVTPRTPGASPFPLGALSSMSLPSIPSMPLPPALTTLATKLPRTAMDMQSGFKEAVRSRWEGQKGRFETASVGKGLLRRRRVTEEEEGLDGAGGDVSLL